MAQHNFILVNELYIAEKLSHYMKNIIAAVILLLSCYTTSYSQNQANNTEEKPFIEVTGTAEKEIIPDEIYVGITLRERMVNKEKLTIESQEEKLKNALKEIGIDISKNLSVSDLNADFIRVRWRKKDVIAQKDYTLKVSDATTLGKVFQKLDELDILDARIQKVNHSKMDSIKKSVKIIAIKAAKDKADYLLLAIGEQTGKPLIIKEEETRNYQLQQLSNRSNVSKRFDDLDQLVEIDKEDEIQYQKIKVQTTIYVKFGIK
jgi:uncharacterized protein YggE